MSKFPFITGIAELSYFNGQKDRVLKSDGMESDLSTPKKSAPTQEKKDAAIVRYSRGRTLAASVWL